MFSLKKNKKWQWIILMVILGAFGSGLWFYIIHPLFRYSSDVILKIITFGFSSFEKNIYMEIAKGYHEATILEILGLFTGFIVGVVFSSILIFIKDLTKKTIYLPNIPKKQFLVILFLVFVSIFMLFSCFRSSYINDKITYYEQLYDTISPHIDEENRIMIKSEFAQIRTKEDYNRIINNLIEIADMNNQTYREYNLFY